MNETYKWIYRETENEALLPGFFGNNGIPNGVARIMWRRGVRTEEMLQHFLYDGLANLADPFLMKGMKEAVDRIRIAIERHEKIVIYGDYDVDGITSTSILYRFFKRIGLDVGFYIPGRDGEGYGLNDGAVTKLCGEGYKLLITVDCGISSAELVDRRADDIDFIITDHHVPPDVLPTRAFGIVNAHQKDCAYPFKEMAGCGTAFYLCRALYKALYGKEYAEDIELVALGTIADMVSLTGENRILVREGMKRFRGTKIHGLSALLRAAGIVNDEKGEKPVTADQVSFGLAPRLNAAGRIAHAKKGVALMVTESRSEAVRLAEELCRINLERQSIEREIYKEALVCVERIRRPGDMALVVDGKDWHPGVIGIVASRILERYHRPVLVITVQNGTGKGSCRSIPGFDMYEALKSQKELLIQFGGHKMAAGFSIKEENIQRFRDSLNAYAKQRLTEEDCIPQLEIEQNMPIPEITLDFIRSLSLLEPCGCDNPKPLFASQSVFVESVRRMGAENRHFKCILSQNGASAEAVFWNPGEKDPCRPGEKVSIAFEPEIHEWYGEHVQMLGRDVKKSASSEAFSVDRDFLVDVFLKLREFVNGGAMPVLEVQELLVEHFQRKYTGNKIKVGLIIFEEIGILSRYMRSGQEFLSYRPIREKLDLTRSPTFCKYRK